MQSRVHASATGCVLCHCYLSVTCHLWYAVAKLGDSSSVTDEWLLDFLNRSRKKLDMFTDLQLANTAWALAKLRATADAAWLLAFVAVARAHLAAGRFRQATLGMVLRGFRVLAITNGPDWEEGFIQDCEAELARLHNTELPAAARANPPAALLKA